MPNEPSQNEETSGPLHALLALRADPTVDEMTEDELLAHVKKLREASNNAGTLTATIRTESSRIKPNSKRAKKKALLDTL